MIPAWAQVFLWIIFLLFITGVLFVIGIRLMLAMRIDEDKEVTAWETVLSEFKRVGDVEGQRIYDVDGKEFSEAQLKLMFDSWFENGGDKK